MYDQYTGRARKSLQLANQEAQRLNHEFIGTEHLLLGLVKEGTGVAATILRKVDVDLRKIRLEVMKVVQAGPDTVTMGKLAMTPRGMKAIDFAEAEAHAENLTYVGTRHILLGLLREEQGVAAQILMNLGFRLADIRQETRQRFQHDLIMLEIQEGVPPDNAPSGDGWPICEPEPSATQVFLAWEKLRLIYNLLLVIVVAPVTGAATMDLLPNLTEAAIVANLFYCFGPVVEGYASLCGMRRRPGRWMIFVLGTVLAIFYAVQVAGRIVQRLPVWPGFPNG